MRNKAFHARSGVSLGNAVGNSHRSLIRSRSQLPKSVKLAGREWSRTWKRLCAQNKRLQRENHRLREERAKGEEREKEWQRKDNLLREILEELHDVVLIHDKRGTCVSCFAKDESDLVLPAEQCVGRNVADLAPKSVADKLIKGIRNTLALGQVQTMEYGLRLDGDERFFEGRMIPYGPNEVLSAICNITERKRSEEVLRQSEENYRLLIETVSYGINEIDMEGTIIHSNSAFHKMHGYEDGELIGTSMLDLIASDYLKKNYFRIMRRIRKENPEPTFVYSRNRTRDGRIIIIKVEWNYKCDAEGKIIGIISVVTDVTEQRKSEKALIESEKKHRAIYQSFPDLIFIFDGKGSYLEVHAPNPVDIAGRPKDLIGRNISEILPVPVAQMAQASIKLALQSGEVQNFDFNLPFENGTQYYEGRMVAYEPNKVLSFVRNITTRRIREEALRQSEERYRVLFETIPHGILDIDREGRITAARGCPKRVIFARGF